MHKKEIFFYISIIILLSFSIGYAQSIGGGGSSGYSMAGCWDHTTSESCSATSGCSWHTTESWGWCEEKGCWSYNTNDTCIANNCTWEPTYNYCYKKGCW